MDENFDKILELTADVVAAHVSNNSVSVNELPGLIQSVYSALSGLGGRVPEADVPELKPAVSVRSSVKRDAIVCLECGKKHKTLRRHLATAHGLDPEQYRERWGLAADYPMVAAEYSELRAGMARAIGLGRGGNKRAKPAKRK